MNDDANCPTGSLPDWNALWKENHRRERARSGERSDYWNKRAPTFARKSRPNTYADQFLAFLDPDPQWSVLDVGCGPGLLAHPLAARVQSVTGMDFSEVMIQRLSQGAIEKELSNLRAVHGSWEDDWESLGIGVHDAAFASRSLIVEDLEVAIDKLERCARKRVMLSCPAGAGPLDADVMDAVGRRRGRGADYIYVYNYLHQRGICADVKIVRLQDDRTFDSREDALDFHRLLIEDLNPEEDQRLQDFLERRLVPLGQGWGIEGSRGRAWALIRWDREV
nr:class I SAM-dependent methyltransferase [uncultured Holophaga sp.]